MSFTKEDVIKAAGLVVAGGPNIEIAKQLYVNFIQNNSEFESIFWTECFKDWETVNDYKLTEKFNDFFQDVVCESFGIDGIGGIVHAVQNFPELAWTDFSKNEINIGVGVPPNTPIKWHIHGMNVWHRISGATGYGFHNVSDYEFILRGQEEGYRYRRHYASVRFHQRHGCCGSGYCPASWGNVEIKKINGNTTKSHYLPAETIPVELISIQDNKYLLDNNGDLIYATGDGGDSYYPRGYILPNQRLMELFTPVAHNRLLDKPNVYFLAGDSGLGKSYLANLMHNDLYVFETDAVTGISDGCNHIEVLSEMICADVIVVGGKHKELTLDKVIETYRELLVEEKVDANIIICNFSKHTI